MSIKDKKPICLSIDTYNAFFEKIFVFFLSIVDLNRKN